MLRAILLIPFLMASPSRHRLQTPTQPATSYTYVGTVHAVNPQNGTLDLITGVGMSLRLVHMTAGPVVRTSSPATGIRIADVKPGDAVRVECRRTSAPPGLVVNRIEKIEAPAR